MELAVSLTADQIAAANSKQIDDAFPRWRRADEALDLLHHRCPGFDSPAATLLKVVSINALYSTNVYALDHVAQHFHTALNQGDPTNASVELVEHMADAPPIDGKTRHIHSLASKFAHFFIDGEQFPILDQYAELTVAHHLGREVIRDTKKRYEAYFQCVERKADD